jgi:hypothetical protein
MFDLPPVSLATLRGEPPPAPVYPFQLPLSYPLAAYPAYPAFPTGYLANGDPVDDPDHIPGNVIDPLPESVVGPLPGPEPEPPAGIAPVPPSRCTRKSKAGITPDDSASQTPAPPLKLKKPTEKKEKNKKAPPADGEPAATEKGRQAPAGVLQKAERKLHRAQEDIEKEIRQTERALEAVKKTVADAEKDVRKAETSCGRAPREKQAAAAAPRERQPAAAKQAPVTPEERLKSICDKIVSSAEEIYKLVYDAKVERANYRNPMKALSRSLRNLRRLCEAGDCPAEAPHLATWLEYVSDALKQDKTEIPTRVSMMNIVRRLQAVAGAVSEGKHGLDMPTDEAKGVMTSFNMTVTKLTSAIRAGRGNTKDLIQTLQEIHDQRVPEVDNDDPTSVGSTRLRKLRNLFKWTANELENDPTKAVTIAEKLDVEMNEMLDRYYPHTKLPSPPPDRRKREAGKAP